MVFLNGGWSPFELSRGSTTRPNSCRRRSSRAALPGDPRRPAVPGDRRPVVPGSPPSGRGPARSRGGSHDRGRLQADHSIEGVARPGLDEGKAKDPHRDVVSLAGRDVCRPVRDAGRGSRLCGRPHGPCGGSAEADRAEAAKGPDGASIRRPRCGSISALDRARGFRLSGRERRARIAGRDVSGPRRRGVFEQDAGRSSTR